MKNEIEVVITTRKGGKTKKISWGSREHFEKLFGGTDVRELSRKCKATKFVKDAAAKASTKADGFSVDGVFDVTDADGNHLTVARVYAGLLGDESCRGSQADYFLAMSKFLKGNAFAVHDIFASTKFDCLLAIVSKVGE